MSDELMSVNTAQESGNDLLRELAEHVGDPEAVAEVLRDWFAEIGANNLALVAILALETTFADCMSLVPPHEMPPRAITFARAEAAA